MKKLLSIFSILMSLSSSIYASDAVLYVLSAPALPSAAIGTTLDSVGCEGGTRGDINACDYIATTGGALVYVSSTIGLIVLLKKDNVQAMIDKSEMEGQTTPELSSLLKQVQSELKDKTGQELDETEVLALLEAQI